MKTAESHCFYGCSTWFVLGHTDRPSLHWFTGLRGKFQDSCLGFSMQTILLRFSVEKGHREGWGERERERERESGSRGEGFRMCSCRFEKLFATLQGSVWDYTFAL